MEWKMGLQAAIPFSHLWSSSILILAQEIALRWIVLAAEVPFTEIHLCVVCFEKELFHAN